MKILLAAILGSIVMFIWTSVAHMALPLGEAGIGEIPNESDVLNAMQSKIGEQTGLYIFPGLGVGQIATRQEQSEAMKHLAEVLRLALSNRRELLSFPMKYPYGQRGSVAYGSVYCLGFAIVASEVPFLSRIGRCRRSAKAVGFEKS